MWWRRASRLKTARSSRAASTSAKRGQREQRPTRSRKKWRRVLRPRRRNRRCRRGRRSAVRHSLFALVRMNDGASGFRKRASFWGPFFFPLLRAATSHSQERRTKSDMANPTLLRPATASELCSAWDGRGRPSPHKLPSPHERAQGSLLVAVVSASSASATPAKGADLFLRRSAGNSERNSQSPAATAAAQVKEPSARAKRD